MQEKDHDAEFDRFVDDCMEELDTKKRETPDGVTAKPEMPSLGANAEAGDDFQQKSPVVDSVPVLDDAVASPVNTSVDSKPKRSTSLQHSVHLATSTFMSLVMVLALLLLARLLVPSLVENVRYSWHKGELRAEYELSDERLRNVSLDSLTDVSQLVSRRVGPSVVHINLIPDEETIAKFKNILGKGIRKDDLAGQGSGFVIDSQGYIITNHHVVEEVGAIEVTLADGRQLPAKVVGSDPLTDLAVLKVDANDLLPCSWGNSEKVVVGTPVWAVGSPFGLQQTVTFGIISGKHRVNMRPSVNARDIPNTPYSDLMQSDVALNRGNSGGPLVNAQGEVVGVNAAILGETFRGVSFSIPSHVAQKIAKTLIAEGAVERGWLGVQLADLSDEERFDAAGRRQAGVRVNWFPDISPAKEAGLQVGDIIVAFEGEQIYDVSQLIRHIGELTAGTKVGVTVLRDGKSLDFTVRLDQRDPDLR